MCGANPVRSGCLFDGGIGDLGGSGTQEEDSFVSLGFKTGAGIAAQHRVFDHQGACAVVAYEENRPAPFLGSIPGHFDAAQGQGKQIPIAIDGTS